MRESARFTEPAAPLPRTLGADQGGGLEATPLANHPRRLVHGQELYSAFGQIPIAKRDNLEREVGSGTKVVFIVELLPDFKHPAQRRFHARLAIHGRAGIALAANFKRAHVAAAFKPRIAEKIVELSQRSGYRRCHMHPVLFGVTPFNGYMET